LEQLSKNTNILVTGGSGQVGSNLRNFKHKENLKFYFPESKVFNLLKKESMVSFLANNKIDLILNLAAYTEVDNSEKNKSLCREINLDGVITLSKIAKERDIGFIQISTDYVFGNNYKGIRNVNDEHNPVNYYGKTKSEAERFVLNISENNFIIRLASVFGLNGNNFIKTITKLILDNKDLEVVYDQKISLTSSEQFSKNFSYLIDLYKEKIKSNNKIIHFTNKGYTNWYDVSIVVKDEIESIINRKLKTNIKPISSKDWVSSAKRPDDSRLNVDFNELENFNIFLPTWEMSVRDLVKEFLSEINGEYKYEK